MQSEKEGHQKLEYVLMRIVLYTLIYIYIYYMYKGKARKLPSISVLLACLLFHRIISLSVFPPETTSSPHRTLAAERKKA